ncbi:hypothetical protein [Ornithinibacillus halotolerans]|uniref:Yip1 domain-containing protein n=1 Tax=Ornithinibacillus halotolerans TaxID=1274357 RepID=A0A916WD67_9BACI|nr:hypothetical protein [Ornithinibacillus halotolerans]GGA88018.1 hypothetical protein GCM10008025_33420 [Ornithinibacillus halotolerans]
MTYSINLIKLLFAVDDHIYRIGKAELIRTPWKVMFLLLFLSLFVYSGMAMLGIGSQAISSGATIYTQSEFEMQKLWFIIGRIIYSLLFFLFVLFVPSFIFYLVTKIPYKKLLLMQTVVLFVLLLERVIWIPLVVYFGLDWYVSPLSFGIIASYLTDISYLIFLFGSISIFQLWIVGFQIKFLKNLSATDNRIIWATVILFNAIVWVVTALVAYTDNLMVNRWFNL